MRARSKLRSLVAKTLSNENGVAAVEFALAMPIMLVLYLGSVEGSTLIILDRKVQTAASALGDLVARTNGTLSQGTLEDYFQAASGIMHPYDSTTVVQTIAGVEVSAAGEAVVKWSKQYTDGQIVPAEGFTIELPQEMTDLALGRVVIVAETSYEYSPSFAVVVDQTVQLHRTSYHIPRTTTGVIVSP
ncbi:MULTISPECIES: TadE/TadG family type IV pilus assembly protein [unclassified Devosia]|uniref:TadE/TadG family type IV pilus assembly protein n=1 Tax=unclassified Devosia TaxID=196773 RepID=UPI00145C61AE|nr:MULTISPECIES: TadE/TadG family type IV pilus assembly protein [unclassified Devosia]MBJ6988803.1 pilus assembly protein [Devosia sp. MC521]QMW63063.1 pilus assembly protein [Devosia sp. MC521]